MIQTRTFEFLNKTGVGLPRIPWSSSERGLLWCYHLNYFDFLNGDLSKAGDESLLESALDIAVDWILGNPAGSEPGWMPYPLSLRIVNWLKFLVRNVDKLDELETGESVRAILTSLADQAATLQHRLERDLLANHFLKNIKALIFAGALIDCTSSSEWWSQGAQLLQSQIQEQILSDGGHFERSPMYHLQVFEDLLDIKSVVVASGRKLPFMELLSERIAAMADFTVAILHPDGEIPLFNDSALHVTRPPAVLIREAGRPGTMKTEDRPFVKTLPATGYASVRDDRTQSALILDCGPIGPDFNPGHAHCDVLSYELSLHGQRVAVDSGVSTYERGRLRQYERSTAAHNTIRVDGVDQAEIWASFRVGRRPRVGTISTGEINGYHFAKGSHFAYQHLGVTHSRIVVLTPHKAWVVVDCLQGTGVHYLESFVHFHPAVSLQTPSTGRNSTVVSFGSHPYVVAFPADGELQAKQSWYSPEFGLRQERLSLCWRLQPQLPAIFAYAFVPYESPMPIIEVLAKDASCAIDGQPFQLQN